MVAFCYVNEESDDYTPVAKFPDRIMSIFLPFYSLLDIKQSFRLCCGRCEVQNRIQSRNQRHAEQSKKRIHRNPNDQSERKERRKRKLKLKSKCSSPTQRVRRLPE